MFGYVTVNRDSLSPEDFARFRAYYCGLCRQLAEYGIKGRLLLNYDCTFLYLLSSALSQQAPRYEQMRCPVHPMHKIPQAFAEGREYAAAMNLLLGYFARCDIVKIGNKMGRFPFCIANGGNGEELCIDFAIFTSVPKLTLPKTLF